MFAFVRPRELWDAKWAEFDFERKEWRISAERMKMKEEHVVIEPPKKAPIHFT